MTPDVAAPRSSAEVERIRRAYEKYRTDAALRRRWDPVDPGNRAIHAERAAAMRDPLERGGLAPLGRRRVLDLGCGSGEVLVSFLELGAAPEDLYGVDLCPEEIEVARRARPEIHWHCTNGEELPYAPGFFGLVLLFTALSSIRDDAMARALVAQVDRVLHRDGALLWHDFRVASPYNCEVRGMSLRRVRALVPGWRCELRPITLLPPLARRLPRVTPVLHPALAAVRPLRTHLIGLLRKPASGPEVPRTSDPGTSSQPERP